MTLIIEAGVKEHKTWREWINGVISRPVKAEPPPAPVVEPPLATFENYRLALEMIPGILYMVNWVDKRVVFANQDAMTFFGHFSEGQKTLEFSQIEASIHPDDQDAYKNARRLLRTAPQGDTVEVEMRSRNYQDQWCWLHITAKVISKTQEGIPELVLWYAQDITERKLVEARLVFASYHDTLTGLYNRAYFEEELNKLEGGRNYPLGILMLDIDNMKQTNDNLGHSAGDELIRRVAGILKSVFRREDVIARIGGDEFAILLPKTDRTQAVKSLARVRLELQKVNAMSGGLPISLSIGMAVATFDSDLRQVLKRADESMYQEKYRHGGRRVGLASNEDD